MIRKLLMMLFAGILLGMLFITTKAAFNRSIFALEPQLTSDPWFHATLVDAYCGFVTFYVWVAYKETAVWARVAWFVLIMTLGNIAMSVYMLNQLWRWDETQGIAALLCRDPSE
ncbi:MAG: DUF1475 family protein [Planctomycetales bacterium]|nr:DUF1475 family protein [Planctomycetales bacterium]